MPGKPPGRRGIGFCAPREESYSWSCLYGCALDSWTGSGMWGRAQVCWASPRQALAEPGAPCEVRRVQGASPGFAFSLEDA